jgi:hypothetical protein
VELSETGWKGVKMRGLWKETAERGGLRRNGLKRAVLNWFDIGFEGIKGGLRGY